MLNVNQNSLDVCACARACLRVCVRGGVVYGVPVGHGLFSIQL